MWAIYLTIGFVCLFLGFVLGILLAGDGQQEAIGTMNVVEWPDGTFDLLLQLENQPNNLQNGQEVTVRVHRTRR